MRIIGPIDLRVTPILCVTCSQKKYADELAELNALLKTKVGKLRDCFESMRADAVMGVYPFQIKGHTAGQVTGQGRAKANASQNSVKTYVENVGCVGDTDGRGVNGGMDSMSGSLWNTWIWQYQQESCSCI